MFFHEPGANWKARARCVAEPTPRDFFFPTRGDAVRPVKEFCAGCPVIGECLDYALTNNLTNGIWGGCSERERRPMRSRLARGRCCIDCGAAVDQTGRGPATKRCDPCKRMWDADRRRARQVA